jgi:hypothetical protein
VVALEPDGWGNSAAAGAPAFYLSAFRNLVTFFNGLSLPLGSLEAKGAYNEGTAG